nr:hypothetical protein [Tanacetum cinerariifolium]
MGARRQSSPARECTYQDFMKCKPLYFKGTEGVFELTQWFERIEIVFRISNCYVENQIKFTICTLLADLKKKMTDKYCPRGEIKKLEEVIEMATELMDKRNNTFAERQEKNKQKFDDTSKNYQNQQQPAKEKNVARAYTAGSGEKKPYGGSKPLSDCPELKNQNHRNQAEGTGAHRMVHALGGGETNQDLNNMKDDINA